MKKVFFAISSFLSDISAATGRGGEVLGVTQRGRSGGGLSLSAAVVRRVNPSEIPTEHFRQKKRDSDCEGARPGRG